MNQLMLFTEILSVNFENHTHQYISCVQNVQFVKVKEGGTYSNHCTLKRQIQHLKFSWFFVFVVFFVSICSLDWSAVKEIWVKLVHMHGYCASFTAVGKGNN